MPVEFQDPAAPDKVVAAWDEAFASALDERVVREGVSGPFPVIARDPVDETARFADDVVFGSLSRLLAVHAGFVECPAAEGDCGALHANAGNFPEDPLPPVDIGEGAAGTDGPNGPSTIQVHALEHSFSRRACA